MRSSVDELISYSPENIVTSLVVYDGSTPASEALSREFDPAQGKIFLTN